MRFRQVQLQAPVGSLSLLDDFYAERLGLERLDEEGVGVNIGETQLVFRVGAGRPFYHFALLVPGNRFDEALAWIADRTVPLPDPESGEVLFDFDNWGALACYFHDPVGNIVELIAHRGIDESSAEGSFTARELVGFSELGLVGDKAEMATALQSELGLEQWDGDLGAEARLAFVGEKARTFILSPEGRGWLPTARPAEEHPCEVVLSGSLQGEALLGDSRYRIRGVASEHARPAERRT
jgi:catechol 2,3-dioxygenase-like lactoylglutathione lyase family enzyme